MWTARVHSSADPSASEILPHHSLTPTDWDDIARRLIKEEEGDDGEQNDEMKIE